MAHRDGSLQSQKYVATFPALIVGMPNCPAAIYFTALFQVTLKSLKEANQCALMMLHDAFSLQAEF